MVSYLSEEHRAKPLCLDHFLYPPFLFHFQIFIYVGDCFWNRHDHFVFHFIWPFIRFKGMARIRLDCDTNSHIHIHDHIFQLHLLFTFLAFFIGNVQNKVGFFVLYSIQLLATIVSVNIGFIMKDPTFFSQFPFMLICVVGVILLPFNTYNRNKRDRLEEQLEDAHKRISELGKMEERQRIARDLHDTLGQKLSLIGLKSDLAGKLIDLNPDSAKKEIKDIRQTARTALKEVREMVSEMRGAKLSDEIIRVKQILKAAEIEFKLEGTTELQDTPLLVETVLSMCLKEAVTNIVKHSCADCCNIVIEELKTGVTIKVQDNGVGLSHKSEFFKGNGLQGMKERLEFVNGSLDIKSTEGTTLYIRVPNAIKNNE